MDQVRPLVQENESANVIKPNVDVAKDVVKSRIPEATVVNTNQFREENILLPTFTTKPVQALPQKLPVPIRDSIK